PAEWSPDGLACAGVPDADDAVLCFFRAAALLAPLELALHPAPGHDHRLSLQPAERQRANAARDGANGAINRLARVQVQKTDRLVPGGYQERLTVRQRPDVDVVPSLRNRP